MLQPAESSHVCERAWHGELCSFVLPRGVAEAPLARSAIHTEQQLGKAHAVRDLSGHARVRAAWAARESARSGERAGIVAE